MHLTESSKTDQSLFGKVDLDNFTNDLKKLKEEAEEVVGGGALKKNFNTLVKRWKGKSLLGITKKEIAEALKGTTEQANKIADLIENEKMIIEILDDVDFEKMLIALGDTADEARKTAAFNSGTANYFRSSTSIENFLSEIVHEGTHTLDNLEIRKLFENGTSSFQINRQFGNNHSFEKRAFFHERAFQLSTGTTPDFNTIEEMLEHISRHYSEN